MKNHYSIGYFISQAVKGLWRNGVMSFASIAVLMCCLVVMGIFTVLVANINENLETMELANEIVVFLDYDATEDDAKRVEEKIKELSTLGVGEVVFVSKEQALEEMRAQYSDYAQLFDSIGENENPLAYSFEITVVDVSRGVELQFALETLDDAVRKVNNRMDLAQQFETIKKNITYAFGIFLSVLLFVCLFVIINTISLAVYARRNEIIVMRYVGAARWFIATPFILEGVIIGLVASGLAFFIEGQIYMYITSMITGELGLIKLIPYAELRDLMLYSFLGVGVLTGVVGSILSLRKRVEA